MCWDFNHVPPCLVYKVMRIKPRTPWNYKDTVPAELHPEAYGAQRHCTSWAIPRSPWSTFIFLDTHRPSALSIFFVSEELLTNLPFRSVQAHFQISNWNSSNTALPADWESKISVELSCLREVHYNELFEIHLKTQPWDCLLFVCLF